ALSAWLFSFVLLATTILRCFSFLRFARWLFLRSTSRGTLWAWCFCRTYLRVFLSSVNLRCKELSKQTEQSTPKACRHLFLHHWRSGFRGCHFYCRFLMVGLCRVFGKKVWLI